MAFRLAWVPPDIEREPERDLDDIYNAFTYCPCKKCPLLSARGESTCQSEGLRLTQFPGCSQLRVPLATLLYRALHGVKIDKHEPEALRIALRPLVVVHQTPCVIGP